MIHVYDDDERQVTDAANYAMNHGSFAEVSINMNKALKRLGFYADPDDAEWVGMVASLGTNFRYKNKKNFIIHVWETTSMPVFVYQQAVSCQERIFGLSDQITHIWHRYGRPDVQTVYGGCDTEFWQQTKPKNPSQFQFCHVNSSNVRSGLDITLQSFALAFEGNRDVRLVVKDTNPQNESSVLLAQISALVHKYNVDIVYHSRRESMLWLRDLYSESHVTLNLLRATSFGMPLLECGACDSLCVTGDIPPTNEMIKSSHGVLIPASHMVKVAEVAPMLSQTWGLLNCFGNFPHIEEPYIASYDVNKYAHTLQRIFKDWQSYATIDKRGPIVENWSWDKSAKRLKEQLYGV